MKVVNLYIPNKNKMKEKLPIKSFIEFNKDFNHFFDNLYLSDCKYVVKIPINKEGKIQNQPKIERFNLNNTIYLVSY